MAIQENHDGAKIVAYNAFPASPVVPESVMSLSLQEQLLKAGLVNENQLKKAEQQRKQTQHQHHKQRHDPKVQQRAQQQEAARAKEQAERKARDQELNRKKREAQERNARFAEIRQLIEQHRLPRIESEEFFNFIHNKKVHRMAVDAERRIKLQNGELKIVRYSPGYAVVTPEIAARIAEREASQVVDLSITSTEDSSAEIDEAYKDFVVPDDLMW